MPVGTVVHPSHLIFTNPQAYAMHSFKLQAGQDVDWRSQQEALEKCSPSPTEADTTDLITALLHFVSREY